MDALQRVRREPLVARLCGEIRQHNAQRVAWLSDAALRTRVVRGIKLAEGYGLESDWSRATFVLLMFAVSPRFAEHHRFAAALADTERAGDACLRLLLRRATATDWAEAALLAGPPSPPARDGGRR